MGFFSKYLDSESPFLVGVDGVPLHSRRQFLSIALNFAEQVEDRLNKQIRRVLFLCSGGIEEYVCLTGLLEKGCIVRVLNPFLSSDVIVENFKSFAPDLIIVCDRYGEMLPVEIESAEIVKISPLRSFRFELLSQGTSIVIDESRPRRKKILKSTGAGEIEIFTSGSTGEPKNIRHSVENLFQCMEKIKHIYDFDIDSIHYNNLPFYYLGGISNHFICSIVSGGSTKLLPQSKIDNLFFTIEEFCKGSSNVFWMPTNSYKSIYEYVNEKRGYWSEKENKCLVGMESVSKEFKVSFKKLFGLNLCESYGLSESNLLTAARAGDLGIGACLPGVKLEIRNPDTENVGEVFAKTNHMCLNPSNMHDGWYATGDLGIREQKGNISICGRKKWIIKKNGQLINPLSIERRITNKLGTDKVFVVGITDSIRGEAIVFLTTLSKSEWNNIKDKVLAVLAVHEKPRQTIHVSEVPLTKTKKIDRIRLSELANKKCVDKLAA